MGWVFWWMVLYWPAMGLILAAAHYFDKWHPGSRKRDLALGCMIMGLPVLERSSACRTRSKEMQQNVNQQTCKEEKKNCMKRLQKCLGHKLIKSKAWGKDREKTRTHNTE